MHKQSKDSGLYVPSQSDRRMDGEHIHSSGLANLADRIPQKQEQNEIPRPRRTSKHHEVNRDRTGQNRVGTFCGRKNDEENQRNANNVHVQQRVDVQSKPLNERFC